MILLYMVLSFALVIGGTAPMLVGIIFGLPLPIVLGAWCVHDRATHRDGTPLDWLGAFKLSGLALALNVLFAALLIGVGLTL